MKLTATCLQNLVSLEDAAGAEIIPGTEVMVDVGAYHFVKSEGNRTVLVPQPSNDPRDPLVSFYTTQYTKKGEKYHRDDML